MKSLIIAEKPSVAADLARALGKVPKKGDHFENDEYVISSAVGHLVELLMPEDIDKKKYGFWRLEMLPIIPERFELKPIEDSKERFDHLKKLLARKDIDLVINACDAGREGELIFTYIYQLTKSKLPVKRAWMQTMTAEGIREAFRSLRDGAQMAGLADAARCRSESDWLVGINGTRALTKRMFGSRAGNVASVGRVQTPTLAMIYARELEIRQFKPRAFWRVTAGFELEGGAGYDGTYQRPNFKKSEDDEHDRIDRIWDEAQARAVLAACQGRPPAAVSDERKASTQAPPRLYDLTTLQREANNRFSLPARRTLQIAQALYERHKMITYPRTDSRALPEDYIPTVRQTLGNLGAPYAVHAQKVLEAGWITPNKRIFNNAQISDHFAIIPTFSEAKPLEDIEAKIFDMIARRFIAVFFPSAEFDITVRRSVVAGHTFRSEGKVLTLPGWLEVYGRTTVDEGDERNTSLPPLPGNADAASATTVSAELHGEATRPPPRYTEATLLSAMEGAGKLVEDEELAEAMKERGLGTPATRADTIDGLINQKYVERAQRELIPTAKAEQLLQFLAAVRAEQLTSPAMTGEWEFKLRQMEHGKFTRPKFMEEVAAQTRGIVERVKGFEEDETNSPLTDLISPTDGKPMRETLRGYKSQDGELIVYKVIGGRKMELEEARKILTEGQIGPLDGFRSAKSGKPYSAVLRYNKEEKKVEFVFDGQRDATGALRIDFTGLQPFAPAPAKYGDAQLYETPQSYVVRKIENGEDKILARCSKRILSRDIPREQFLKLLETGKTDLLDKFWSQRTRRPFSAFLVLKEDGNTAFEFAPRPPKDPNAPARKGLRRKKVAAPEAPAQ
ncbi:MAG TPA: DNA topoisomerase 3 [Opitutaceae bacterium]|nr:DNA topoisomerase 3 [Opitutaceae bacterium]